MRLFEHVEFEQAMLRAAEHFDVSEQFIEKDYYVTEILRIVGERLPGQVLFKTCHSSTFAGPSLAGLSFAASQALFPDAELSATLAADYERQCRLLFSNPDYPQFDEVLARFEEIRELL